MLVVAVVYTYTTASNMMSDLDSIILLLSRSDIVLPCFAAVDTTRSLLNDSQQEVCHAVGLTSILCTLVVQLRLFMTTVINPRRACAARVTVVVLCVCVCVRGPHLQLAQLSDKVGILAVSVSCSLVFKKGVFRTIAFWRS